MQVIQEIPIEQIIIPQERLTSTLTDEEFTALCESIRHNGLISPILLTPQGPKFLLVSGLNRLRAFQALDLKTIHAIIRQTDTVGAAVLNITENLARGRINPIDEALAIWFLTKNNTITVETVAQLVSRPKAWVEGRLELLQLPEGLQEVIQDGHLSVAAAKELSVIQDPHMLEYLVNQAIESGASAKTIRHWIGKIEGDMLNAALLTPSKNAPFPPSPPPVPLIDCFACASPCQPHDLRPELLCENCRATLLASPSPAAPEIEPG